MQNQRQIQQKFIKPPTAYQSINPMDEDTKILSNVDCSNELLPFSRPMQAPSYSDQYLKKKSQQKQKELLPPTTSISSNIKTRKKPETVTDRSTSLLISTSLDKVLSPKTNYNFIPRSNSQKRVSENNKTQIENCSDINFTTCNNSHNTTCVYSSAEGYWQKRELEKRKKLDKIRDDNYQRELDHMRDRPNISKNSQRIANHLRSKSKEQVFDRLSSGVDIRKRNEDIKQIEFQNSQNRKPIINQSSQRLQRTIDDLYQWKVQIERKKLENKTLSNNSFVPTPIINGESEDILKERKPDYLRKRVEDRLIEQGEINKIKKEEKKEHYHERLMGPNEEKKCYLTTCPSKKSGASRILQPQNNIINNLPQNNLQKNSSKKYIQKSGNISQNSSFNENNVRSLSGRMRYSNDISNNNNNEGLKRYSVTNNQKPTAIYNNNPFVQNIKTYDYNKANSKLQDCNNLSYDINCNQRMQQQLQSPQRQLNQLTSSNNNSSNNSNLVDIRKHLNDYYEQKSQKVNKSFSYNNNQRNNVPKAAINKTKPAINQNMTSNSKLKNNANPKFMVNSNELEEDKIINNIPQNEPQVKCQPVSFQEEEPWIPCGKEERRNQYNSFPYEAAKPQSYNNYSNRNDYPSNEAQGYEMNQRNINHENNYQENYRNNNQNKYYQENRFEDQQYAYEQSSPYKNSNLINNTIEQNSPPQRYNFNHEIFNRFTQEKNKQQNNYVKQNSCQNQQRQYHTITPGLDKNKVISNVPSTRYDLDVQINPLISSPTKFEEENAFNKSRDQTNKRLQDLEQMQVFANNLRQSNDSVYGKKNFQNPNPINVPQAQCSNINTRDYSQQSENMAFLNDRLKLNEKSKSFLYEKMNQISPYQSNLYQDQDIYNQIPDVNTFEFQRKKI